MQDYQTRAKIHPKQTVRIITKEENGEYGEELHEGIVKTILTETSEHYRGIKVELVDGKIGRVREIVKKRKNK